MTQPRNFNNLKKIFGSLATVGIFIFPFSVWLYYFRHFHEKFIKLIVDAEVCFIYTNYYLSHIARGVYPMWNPYNVWGRPDDFGVRMIGEFNPWLYVITVLNSSGFSFSLSYYIYLVTYYFLGVIGFYLLVKVILNDRVAAYLAMLILLFSSLSGYLFNDLIIVLIFIPSVWFFYFAVSFFKKKETVHFLGMILSLMVIVTTYLPFHFLTFFLVFLLMFIILFFKDFIECLKTLFQFAGKHKFIFIFGVVALLLSFLPGYYWSQAAIHADYFFAWRGMKSDPLDLSLRAINLSGLVGPSYFEGFFSHFKDSDLNSFYIPTFIFIPVVLGLILALKRRLILYSSIIVLTIFISLADVTGLHAFLYKHVFFFKYFRNLHFLLWLAFGAGLIFAADQFKEFLSWMSRRESSSQKWLAFVYITVIHVLLLAFLRTQDDVMGVTFAVVVLSYLFFTCYLFALIPRSQRVVCWVLLGIVFIQPAQVFNIVANKYRGQVFAYAQNPITREESFPKFSYVRPLKGQEHKIRESNGYGDVRDTSGFVEWNRFDYGLKWSHFLQTRIDPDILKEYVKYKFIVYDNVVKLSDEESHVVEIEHRLQRLDNTAFIAGGSDFHPTHLQQIFAPLARVITGDSLAFRVVKFDLNEIEVKTNFSYDQFLVYNDSFHKEWEAWVNGKNVQIIRSNVAFKGLWLPAGENTVYMRFRPFWRYYLNLFLLGLFMSLFIYLVFVFGQRLKLKVKQLAA